MISRHPVSLTPFPFCKICLVFYLIWQAIPFFLLYTQAIKTRKENNNMRNKLHNFMENILNFYADLLINGYYHQGGYRL